MTTDRDELIRSRAYELWEAEGAPHGRHDQHWEQATREVDEAEAEPIKPRRRAAGSPNPVAPATPATKTEPEPIVAKVKRAAKAVVAEVTPAPKPKRAKPA